MTVKNWQKSLQPREKALENGIDSLSDSELLALILRNGTKDKSCVALANDILNQMGGFSGLYKQDVNQMLEIKGVGKSKACEMAAVVEIVKRISYQDIACQKSIEGPKDVFNWLKHYIGQLDIEYIIVIFLDSRNRIRGYHNLCRGNGNSVNVDLKSLFNSAIKHNASKIMIAHNHPSQIVEPSLADDYTTQQIRDAGQVMNIPLVDHIIVSYDKYYSYVESHR